MEDQTCIYFLNGHLNQFFKVELSFIKANIDRIYIYQGQKYFFSQIQEPT